MLLSLNEDSLLKPWRLRAGLPAPGPELGGWYDEVPLEKTESGGHGFAPAHSFGQWLSALARGYNANRDAGTRAKVERLLDMYEPAISGQFYRNFRFPAYVYDKMVIGLIDAHQFADLPQAFRVAGAHNKRSRATPSAACARPGRAAAGVEKVGRGKHGQRLHLGRTLHVAGESVSGVGARRGGSIPEFSAAISAGPDIF